MYLQRHKKSTVEHKTKEKLTFVFVFRVLQQLANILL